MDPLKEFGEKLKRARTEKGIGLKDIENWTKIRVKYLTDIENGEFDNIPGGEVYVKGFISNYAKTVGLDVKAVIAEYKELAHKTFEAEDTTTAENEKLAGHAQSAYIQSNIFIKYALVIGVLLLVIFSVVFISNRTAKAPEQRAGETGETTDKQLSSTESQLPVNDTPSDVQQKEEEIEVIKLRDDSVTEYMVKKADKITVKLTVKSGRCWVSVKSDGKKIAEKTFEAGQGEEWTAEREMIIRVGNPTVSEIGVNGVDLGIPGGLSRNFIFKKAE